jgi:ADP-dependent NAD(P)H-hydrate dehydratase / NAD(P)H-hydrate epimerase
MTSAITCETIVADLPVLRGDDVRAIEALVAAQADPPNLMERAGLAAAELARDLLLGGKRSVLVLAGPGNNGGDGFIVARHLRSWWYQVEVVFIGTRDRLSAEAGAAHDAWLAAGGEVLPDLPSGRFDLVIDALFGIGLQRELSGQHANLVERVKAQPSPVLALDVPSGLHADTGRVLGSAVRAQHTVTFIALKPGLLTLDGPDHAGTVHVCDLGLDVPALRLPPGRLVASALLGRVLAPRSRNSHKGTFGSVGILGGAAGMTGAALLAARAALYLGAGRTYVGLIGVRDAPLDPMQPELMLREADEIVAMRHLSCLVVGPGLGQSPPARGAVARALELDVPLVLDADALNLIGAHDALGEVCAARSVPTVLTPHPAEAARLLRTGTAEIQADRIGATVALSQRFRASVALKGAGTIVSAPSGSWRINTSGNPGLASAGMGDVLSGIIGALVSQGAPPHDALLAGVHLHGLAADQCVRDIGGPIGLTASEVSIAARRLLNAWIYTAGKPARDA